ncbi:phosphatidylinositol 4-phosphate 5-kinase-like protein 1 isoform X2 [Rhinatrema bivittatum]|uniref:phosphatidylinositol 4-phosphate 5-kinase-like protein 1 isoform X2 n=1 Tax=Rhinatrema bivittatum TaxID=194408 RepID=UPI001126D507|nr:phosphatidylinositol 4-phosphate 5-kinase-like protein 1 isoform X2 [Rhinatrema bivittatum]
MEQCNNTTTSLNGRCISTETRESMLSRKSRIMKRRLFLKLRQKWKLLGLFEIDGEHEFYSLTCLLKEGLQAALQESIDNPVLDPLCDTDYKAVLTQAHEEFEMRTFAGPVFTHFRQSLGMAETDYQRSLSSDGFYLQFISNSKSKADFFLTNDKRFFLKTQSKKEVRFLLKNLKKYIQYLEMYPHSLLVKFLGIHSIRLPQERKKYFIIMQSVFYPDERIIARYDIKGCQVNRWTEPASEGSQIIVVLKDLNFEGNCICLAQQRAWLIQQIQLDTKFLQDLHVLDYSLLVAFQPLHADERSQSWSFANLILRTKKSINAGGSPTTSAHTIMPGVVEEEGGVVPASEVVSGTEPCCVREKPGGNRVVMKKIGPQLSAESDLSDILAQNRRLLPTYKNPLHVLDGPELRYFLGIIDIFTVYGFGKKLEHLWKSIRYRGQTFSTVSPASYAQRLRQWVETHTV